MLKTLGLRMIQAGYRLTLGPAQRRFDFALRNCEKMQGDTLSMLVAANRDTAYGKAHDFSSVLSLRNWQDRVPIVDYEDLHPWVERVAAGEAGVLTAEPVRIFEKTSGSSAPSKLIPCTASLLREFAAATGPWLHNLYTTIPDLRGTTSYWSISPVTRQRERTAGGIPVGFDEDTEYFGPLARIALRSMLAVPSEVARLGDMESWIDATARYLVAAEDLGLISIWHPSFFSLLIRRIEERLNALLDTVSPRRAATVRARLQNMALGEALWPRLAVVSCWADGAAEGVVPGLAKLLPQARIQPKGLLATEGVVSFPVQRENGTSFNVAAISGHFLEFIDLDHSNARPRLAHELQRDAVYTPVISTGGGFYRYRLGDAVRCTGFHGQAPELRFEGRTDQVSDLCGEKLNPRMVAAALEEAQQELGVVMDFALVATTLGDPPHYHLYVEGLESEALSVVCEIVERAFCDNPGYRYARALGQLGPMRGVLVNDGAVRYVRAKTAAGQRAGNIKPSQLDNSLEWSRVFGDVAREYTAGAPS